MAATVTHCPACSALVNLRWPACAACKRPLTGFYDEFKSLRKPTHAEWLAAWRELTDYTAGLLPDDPRVPGILQALKVCDERFLAGDWLGFLDASNKTLDALGFTVRAAHPIGTCIQYEMGLGRVETGVVRGHTTWHFYPNQVCYLVGTRTIPHSRVRGVVSQEGVSDGE